MQRALHYSRVRVFAIINTTFLLISPELKSTTVTLSLCAAQGKGGGEGGGGMGGERRRGGAVTYTFTGRNQTYLTL